MNRPMVTPFEKMKILGMYGEAKRIKEGKIPYPRMAIVYPTYVCNHNCRDCLYGEWNRSHHAIMDPRRFPELVEALVSLRIKAVEGSRRFTLTSCASSSIWPTKGWRWGSSQTAPG